MKRSIEDESAQIRKRVQIQPDGQLKLDLYVRRAWQRQVVSVWREGRAAFPSVTLNIVRGDSLIQLLHVKPGEAENKQQPQENITAARHYLEGQLGFRLSEEPLLQKKYQLQVKQIDQLNRQHGRFMMSITQRLGLGIRYMKKTETGYMWVEGIEASIKEFEREVAKVLHDEIKEFKPTSWAAKAAGGGVGAPKSSKIVEKPLKPTINPQHGEITECLFFEKDDQQDRYDLRIFLDYLRSGHKTLDICVFTITNNQIANAILAEFREGVKVRIITDNDKANDLGADIYKLARAGIPVKTDKTEAHMHHKFAVVDGELIINGSFNWTRSAGTRNFENVVISNNPKMVKSFADHFEHLWNANSMAKLGC